MFRTIHREDAVDLVAQELKDIASTSIFAPELVTFLSAKDRDSCLDEMVSVMTPHLPDVDMASFRTEVFKRERLLSTSIGMGVAIPHARFLPLSSFFVGIGISHTGLQWPNPFHDTVHIVFLIGGPEAPSAYLALLSHLTLIVRQHKVRHTLLTSNSAQTIIDTIRSARVAVA